MKKLKILITAVGGDLSQSVIKCLKDCGFATYLVGCDMNPYAAGRVDVDTFLQAPPVKSESLYRDFLLKVIKDQKIEYVFLLTDMEIIFFNENRDLFSDSSATFLVNEKHIIETFMDKYRTIEFFKEKGIPYPKTWLSSDYNYQADFPLILKKRRGSGSQSLVKVNDTEELQFYLKHHSDVIIQEYLPGKANEYTSGIFSDGENIHTITFKRSLAPGGFSRLVELVSDKAITEFPKQIARKLNFKGSINVQFRVIDRGCVPFEINPRFSSTVYFRHRFGFKDVLWSLDLCEGRRVSYMPIYKYGIGVKKFTEAFFNMEKQE